MADVKNYIVVVTNTFDDRITLPYGPYTLEEGNKVLEKLLASVKAEWDTESIYDEATLTEWHDQDGTLSGYTIDWGDDTYTDTACLALLSVKEDK